MPARILAVLAAVAMVVVAVVVRDRVIEGDGGSAGRASSGPLRLVCATEVGDACRTLARRDRSLQVTVEPAAVTADRLLQAAPGEAGLDGWLTPGPWPEMVDVARQAAARPPLFEPLGPPIARSPLVVLARQDTADRLRGPACAGEVPITWACVGDAALAGFRLAAPPVREATGLLVEAALVASHLGDADFARNDLTENLEAVTWSNQVQQELARARSGQAASVERFVAAPAVAEGFATTEATAARVLFPAANRGQFQPVYPVVVVAGGAPVPAVAELMLGTPEGGAGDDLTQLFGDDEGREVIRQAGWRFSNLQPIAGVPQVDVPLPPEGDGLPSAAVLRALQEVLG